MLENQWDSSIVIVSHRAVHSEGTCCFFLPLMPTTKDYYIILGEGMLGILFFSANLCGNQDSRGRDLSRPWYKQRPKPLISKLGCGQCSHSGGGKGVGRSGWGL